MNLYYFHDDLLLKYQFLNSFLKISLTPSDTYFWQVRVLIFYIIFWQLTPATYILHYTLHIMRRKLLFVLVFSVEIISYRVWDTSRNVVEVLYIYMHSRGPVHVHSVELYAIRQSLILVTSTSEISGYTIHIQSTVGENFKHLRGTFSIIKTLS